MADRKEYRKQYRENNAEKIKEYMKEYYQKHKEQFSKSAKKYAKTEKGKATSRRNNLTYGKAHRLELAEKQRKRQKERKQLIDDYKLSRGCDVCGYNKCANALEFHHSDCRKVGEKKFTIASALKHGIGMEIIIEEIKKCVLFCANCHRELHEKDGNGLRIYI